MSSIGTCMQIVAQGWLIYRRSHSPAASLTARPVGVIDRNGNGENHGVARDIVIREANKAGYQYLEQDDFVKDGMDYFLVFSAK
jgi:hypothetical protein